MSKKCCTFASEIDEEPTALATFPKNDIPILTGETADRFIRIAEENEKKANERKNEPISKEEAKKIIGFKKIMLEYEMNKIKKIEEEIYNLEKIING